MFIQGLGDCGREPRLAPRFLFLVLGTGRFFASRSLSAAGAHAVMGWRVMPRLGVCSAVQAVMESQRWVIATSRRVVMPLDLSPGDSASISACRQAGVFAAMRCICSAAQRASTPMSRAKLRQSSLRSP